MQAELEATTLPKSRVATTRLSPSTPNTVSNLDNQKLSTFECALIPYFGSLSEEEAAIVKMVEFAGIRAHALNLSDSPSLLQKEFRDKVCVIASATTLSRALSEPCLAPLPDLLVESGSTVFVQGFTPKTDHRALLSDLTQASLTDVCSLATSNPSFHVSNDKELCKELAGLTLRCAGSRNEFAFASTGSGMALSVLISVENHPFFVRFAKGSSHWFLCSGQAADLDNTKVKGGAILQHLSAIAPLFIFLYHTFGQRAWHSPTAHACFILDDPILSKKRYGFLDYDKVLSVLKEQAGSLSLAFIPWNYRRTDPRVAELFSKNSSNYSICVHGCDHTAREFGEIDQQQLRDKCETSLYRMAQHEKLSGLPFDRVMVFPQGVFSKAAMRALEESGYLAAVNSGPDPVDLDSPGLSLRDLMDVAISKFSKCPLFTRRYPKNAAALAFDLFLGKPAIVVEHHTFFRDGYRPFAECIAMLNSLNSQLKWTNLSTLCTNSYKTKSADDGSIWIQFYTHRFLLTHSNGEPRKYVLNRRLPPSAECAPPLIVASNKATIPITYQSTQNCLTIEAWLGPGESIEVQFEDSKLNAVPINHSQNWFKRSHVFFRRILCEFRDNHVQPRTGRTSRSLTN